MNESESHHLASVLRMREKEEVRVFDGSGKLFSATILAVKKRAVSVQVHEMLEEQRNTSLLHIAIAPTKNIERFEWFIEKATELGIARITPLICMRSERKEVKTERLQKVLLSACKQSLHYTLPQLDEAISFSKFLAAQKTSSATKLIAYCEEHTQHFKEFAATDKELLVLVGPEGDFADEEVKAARAVGFTAVSLGSSRLRLETAGVYVAAVKNALQPV